MSEKVVKCTFDPLDLIELIEQRPCIWDKTIDDYKDKNKKQNAWLEIYEFLIENYANLDEKDKLTAGKAISDKWKHIRDAFSLYLKKKSGDKRKKKYIYFDQLQFLMKILQKDETSSSICDIEDNELSEEEQTSQTVMDFDVGEKSVSSQLRKRKRTPTLDPVDTAILKCLQTSPQPPAPIDEDAGFFTSIIPFVKKFNDDQKIAFRMGVLNLIQQIKAQNAVMPGPPSTSSSVLYTTLAGPSNYEAPQNIYQPQFTNL